MTKPPEWHGATGHRVMGDDNQRRVMIFDLAMLRRIYDAAGSSGWVKIAFVGFRARFLAEEGGKDSYILINLLGNPPEPVHTTPEFFPKAT